MAADDASVEQKARCHFHHCHHRCRNAALDEDWPAEFLSAGRDIKSVKPIIKVRNTTTTSLVIATT